jgi:hypothetical protein
LVLLLDHLRLRLRTYLNGILPLDANLFARWGSLLASLAFVRVRFLVIAPCRAALGVVILRKHRRSGRGRKKNGD